MVKPEYNPVNPLPFDERWFWCRLCKCVSHTCDYCIGTHCNGIACEKCEQEKLRVKQLDRANMLPRPEDIPHTAEQCQAYFTAQWLRRGMTQEKIDKRNADYEAHRSPQDEEADKMEF